MRSLFIFFLACLVCTGCQSAALTESDPANQKRYDLRGEVVSVDRLLKRAKIDHEEIPGFMGKMTMDFPIREDWVWDELKPGALVRAELVVDSSAKEPYWLEKISIVAGADPSQPTVEEKQPEQVG